MIGGNKVKAFNIFDYQGKYAMHCDTEEKAKIFCKYLDSFGMKWRSENHINILIGIQLKKKLLICSMKVLIVGLAFIKE